MIGLVMAGGKGSRMKTQEEKLLLKHIHPTISHVIYALEKTSFFSKIIIATSPNSPKTKEMLKKTGIEIFDTPGKGFVEDLNLILRSFNDDILVVPGDLPLIDDEIINKIIGYYNSKNVWTSFLVTKSFQKTIGVKSDFPIKFQNEECYYSGISIINAKKINNLDLVEENYIILDDKRIGMNLNTCEDYRLLGST
jgi:adenosylcobinamide-phosphate guanylyltransferase